MITADAFTLDDTIRDLTFLVSEAETDNELKPLLMLINRAKVISFPAVSHSEATSLYNAALVLVDGLELTQRQRDAYTTCIYQDYRFYIDQ